MRKYGDARVKNERWPNESDALPNSVWSNVMMGSSGCWYWVGHVRKDGYGTLKEFCNHQGNGKSHQRTTSAHRYVYSRFFDSIPEGLELDHLCRNRSCVNPTHLEPVTHAVNMARTRHQAVH